MSRPPPPALPDPACHDPTTRRHIVFNRLGRCIPRAEEQPERIRIDGRYYPVVHKPLDNFEELDAHIRQMNRKIRGRMTKGVHYIETADWERLIDLLPRCICGRIISPRTMYLRHQDGAPQPSCSQRCYSRRRRYARTTKELRKAEQRKKRIDEALAYTEFL